MRYFFQNLRPYRAVDRVPRIAPEYRTSTDKNGALKCLSCDDGYIMDRVNESCVLKKCFCNNGTPEIGVRCPEDRANKCLSCYNGYTVD